MSVILSGFRHLHVPSNLGLGVNDAGDWTAAIWLKRGRVSHTAEERLLTRGFTGSTTTYAALDITTANVVRAATFFTSGDASSGGTVDGTTAWNLAIGRFPRRNGLAGQSLDCRLNGADGAPDTSARSNTGTFDGFWIGRRSGAATSNNLYFDGLVSHVALWRVRLASAEMDQLETYQPNAITYAGGLSAADLIAYWNLNNSLVDVINGHTLQMFDDTTQIDPAPYYSADAPALNGPVGGGQLAAIAAYYETLRRVRS